eukprot:PRCOL_00001399-RA
MQGRLGKGGAGGRGWTGGTATSQEEAAKLAEFEKRVDPSNKEQMSLLEEMREHTKKLEEARQFEDPRLSFSTPEFKEASRIFTEQFQNNFGRPFEWALVKRHPWSEEVLEKLTDEDGNPAPDGNPWPLDKDGKPILTQ